MITALAIMRKFRRKVRIGMKNLFVILAKETNDCTLN